MHVHACCCSQQRVEQPPRALHAAPVIVMIMHSRGKGMGDPMLYPSCQCLCSLPLHTYSRVLPQQHQRSLSGCCSSEHTVQHRHDLPHLLPTRQDMVAPQAPRTPGQQHSTGICTNAAFSIPAALEHNAPVRCLLPGKTCQGLNMRCTPASWSEAAIVQAAPCKMQTTQKCCCNCRCCSSAMQSTPAQPAQPLPSFTTTGSRPCCSCPPPPGCDAWMGKQPSQQQLLMARASAGIPSCCCC